MSHPEQLAFFERLAAANRDLITGASVLEIGSYDVNGSVRRIFDGAATYTGVDLAPGPGVDRVSYGHELDDPDGSYDLVISGECFEHDPHWQQTLATMARLTRPGGVTAFSCASRGRPEHGTTRTSPDASPGTQSRGLDYYRNLTAADVAAAVDLDGLFSAHRSWEVHTSFDLYFVGIRPGGPRGRIPDDEDIASIARLMPWPHRAIRWPLRVALAALPEERYQPVAIRYWRLQERLQEHPRLQRLRRTGPS